MPYLKVATNQTGDGNAGVQQQQIQVLPTVGGGGQPIMIQGASPQLIQTADGQTLLYQPVQVRLDS